MPVTPFHFGPALLVKAAAPRHFSLVAFGASQVLIDLETIYNIFAGRWPLHRDLHTFLIGTTAATLTGILVGWIAGRVLRSKRWPRLEELPGELTMTGCVIGGLFGGASHAFLDGIMHDDTVPFAPFLYGNPLHQAVDVVTLHLICVVTGLAGVLVLNIRLAGRPKNAPM